MVEAPGTAPGSATSIPHRVYPHSRVAPTRSYIGGRFGEWKGRCESNRHIGLDGRVRLVSFQDKILDPVAIDAVRLARQ